MNQEDKQWLATHIFDPNGPCSPVELVAGIGGPIERDVIEVAIFKRKHC